MLGRPFLGLNCGQGGQSPHQFDDAVGQEVVGVFHGTAAEDVGGIQGNLELALLEVAALAGEAQALLEDGLQSLVQDELGAEDLQGALGEGTFVEPNAECHLPAQVEVGPLLGLLVGGTVVGLQEQSGGQEARGHAGAAVVQDVECGELLVTEELAALAGQETVEGVPADEVQVEVIGLEQAALVGPFTQHTEPPSKRSVELYYTNRPSKGFRPDF